MNQDHKLPQQDLKLLLDIVRALLEKPELERLYPLLLERAMEVCGAERGFLFVRDPQGNLKPVLSRGEDADSAAGQPSRTIIEAALREHRPSISTDVRRDARFTGSESVIIQGIRSVYCIPLEARGRQVGVLYLDRTESGRLREVDPAILEAFGSIAALALAPALDLHQAHALLKTLGADSRFPGLIGESPAMQRLKNRMERVAAADLPVLITGESGTGKELVARALHQAGARRRGPFRAIFCGNLTSELLESELFGYKRGAFTGAVADKPGLLDLADKGTLFLDEVADIPPPIQAKLLRFLQDGEYQRLGDPAPRRADVRVLSATHKSLSEEIAAGRFREDLYYRLNVLTIEVPPLRDREGDLPELAAAILAKVAGRTGQPLRRLSPAALAKLGDYPWPGNVRELENVLARAAVLCASEMIEPEDLDLPHRDAAPAPADRPERLTLQSVVDAHILRVLKLTGGNRSEAARVLGVSRRFLQKTLAKWRNQDTSG